MENTTLFIIYLIIFRLSIIVTGIISIILGYRLFCRGVWPDIVYKNNPSFTLESYSIRFTLKNAAPGTFFALFGIVIICIMIVAGTPQLIKSEGNDTKSTSLKMRSDNIDTTNVHINNH